MEITLRIKGKQKTFVKEHFDLFDLLLVSKHLMAVEEFQAELADKETRSFSDTEKKIDLDAEFMVMLFGEQFTKKDFMTLKSSDYDLVDECTTLALGGEEDNSEKKNQD